MSHHSLPKKWRRSAVTVVLVPSLMCGGHAVVAPTASAAPASSAGSGNVGSTGSAALPGIPDNIIRVLGPALPIVAFLATVFAAATAFSRSGSHTSHSSSTSTNPSPSTSAEATTSGSQQPTTPSTYRVGASDRDCRGGTPRPNKWDRKPGVEDWFFQPQQSGCWHHRWGVDKHSPVETGGRDGRHEPANPATT